MIKKITTILLSMIMIIQLCAVTVIAEQAEEVGSGFLSDIIVEGREIEPGFRPDIKSYTVETDTKDNTFRVTPTNKDMDVVVQIGSQKYENESDYSINLDDANAAIITVKENESVQQVYSLHFIYRVKEIREIYVSEKGSDGGQGTEESPFKTIKKALEVARPDSGDIIRVMPGTYVVERINMVSGVSLIGSGMGKTIIKGTIVDENAPDRQVNKENFGGATLTAFYVSNAEYAHFTLEGLIAEVDTNQNSERSVMGMYLEDVQNLLIHDIEVSSFLTLGAWPHNALNVQFYNMYMHDCGYARQSGCSSQIIFGDCENSSIHDSLLTENRGAYGIKAGCPYWQGRNRFNDIGGDFEAGLENLKIYNNDIDIRQVGGWGSGQPNIAIELWSDIPIGVEIFNNRISDSVSLPAFDDRLSENPIRVHHNEFLADPWGAGYTYAIECSTPNIEIDHNYFHYGIYPIANFGAQKHGVRVHHNIFHDIEQISVMHSGNGYSDSYFVNNYIIFTADKYVKSYTPFMFGSALCENVIVRNNIFYDARPNRNTNKLFRFEGTGKLGDGCQISNNLFYNWNPDGDNAVEADPKFLDNYQLAADSPARKMGIDSLMLVDAGLDENFFFFQHRGENQEVANVYLTKKGNSAQDLLEPEVGDKIETEVIWRNKGQYKFLAEPSQVKYESDNNAVATVDANGVITVVGEGVATVTAQMSDKKGTLILVVGDEPTGLRMLPDKTVLLKGKTAALKVFMDTKYGFSKDVTNTCTFTSADKKVLTIDEDGIYAGKNEGNAIISAKTTIPGMADVSCEIRVRERMLSTVEVTSDRETVYVGEDITVSVSGKDNFGDDIDVSGAEFTYEVDAESGTVVSQNGKTAVINPKKEGNIKISATVYLDGSIVSGNKTVMVYPDTQQKIQAPFAMKHFGNDAGMITVGNVEKETEQSTQTQAPPASSDSAKADSDVAGADTLAEPYNVVIYGSGEATVKQQDDTIAMTSNGANIWGNADDCAFLYQEVDTIKDAVPQKIIYSAKITEADLSMHNDASVGIMFRGDNTASSRELSIRIKKDGTLLFIARATDGAATKYAGGPKLTFPAELRLVKDGNKVEAYYRSGASWKKAEMSGGDIKEFPEVQFGDTLYAGVTLFSADAAHASCKTDGGVIETSDMQATGIKLDNAKITVNMKEGAVQAGWNVQSGVFDFDKEYSKDWNVEYTIEDTSVANVSADGTITGISRGTTALNIKATSPDNEEFTAVAEVRVIDEIVPELEENAYVITSNGKDVWGTSDEGAFLYKPLDLRAADDPKRFEVSATIEAWTGGTDNASAGVMFRDSAKANSKYVGLRVKKDGTAMMTVRDKDGGSTVYASGDKLTFPATIKLIKNGGLVTAQYMMNGGWKELEFLAGDLTQFKTLDFGANVLGGAYAFSGNNSEKAEFTIRDLNVTATELGLDGIALRAEQTFMPKRGQTTKVNVYGVFDLIEASDQFLPNAKFTFESKNPNIASVDQNGVVTGKSTGEAIIAVTAEINGETYTAETPIYVGVEFGSLSRSGWVVTSDSSSPNNTIDGNNDSRWTNGYAQSRASYLKVDLRYNASFNTIVLYDRGGHPGKCDIYISDDGLIWGDPIVSATKPTEKTDTMTIKLPGTYQARYIKIDQPSNSEPEWFSIHELYILNER